MLNLQSLNIDVSFCTKLSIWHLSAQLYCPTMSNQKKMKENNSFQTCPKYSHKFPLNIHSFERFFVLFFSTIPQIIYSNCGLELLLIKFRIKIQFRHPTKMLPSIQKEFIKILNDFKLLRFGPYFMCYFMSSFWKASFSFSFSSSPIFFQISIKCLI